MDNFRRILLGGNGGKPPVPSTPGVYAFFIDGSTSTAASYTAEEKANIIGVLVVDNYEGALHKIVLDKTDIDGDEGIDRNRVYYGGLNKYITYITGATAKSSSKTALKDMNGKANTIAISDACHGYYDGYRVGSAAEDCQARFNGQGYLPSLGEWKMLYNNKSAITKMMKAIGGTALQENSYWSSTLYDASTYSWCFFWNKGSNSDSVRDKSYFVRAVLDPETYIPFPKVPDTPGVYAYFNDGSVSTATSYTEAQKANILGVLVVANYPTSSDLHKIVIDKTDVSDDQVKFGADGDDLSMSGATMTTDSTEARIDMKGKANTIAILRDSPAAMYCQARFNGKGYLPSCGEWVMLYSNKSAITTMMSAIGGTAINERDYWSSTLYDAEYRSWNYSWAYGQNYDYNRYQDFVRAVMQVY